MNGENVSLLRRYRPLWLLLGAVALYGLWWFFRPERLFINQRVNEAAPAFTSALDPVYTGSLKAAGGGTTHGRINILKKDGQLQLEVTNLETNAPGPFVVAATHEKNPREASSAKKIGDLPAGTKHQIFPLTSDEDPAHDSTVLLTDGAQQKILAQAVLEPF